MEPFTKQKMKKRKMGDLRKKAKHCIRENPFLHPGYRIDVYEMEIPGVFREVRGTKIQHKILVDSRKKANKGMTAAQRDALIAVGPTAKSLFIWIEHEFINSSADLVVVNRKAFIAKIKGSDRGFRHAVVELEKAGLISRALEDGERDMFWVNVDVLWKGKVTEKYVDYLRVKKARKKE